MSFDDEDIRYPDPAARKSTTRASKTKSNRCSSHNKESEHIRIDSMKSENIQTSLNESRNIFNSSNHIQVNRQDSACKTSVNEESRHNALTAAELHSESGRRSNTSS